MPPNIRPLPSHLSQLGHLTGCFSEVVVEGVFSSSFPLLNKKVGVGGCGVDKEQQQPAFEPGATAPLVGAKPCVETKRPRRSSVIQIIMVKHNDVVLAGMMAPIFIVDRFDVKYVNRYKGQPLPVVR